MTSNRAMTILILAAVVMAACFLPGCKGEGGARKYVPRFLRKKEKPAPPTEESFRLAAEGYFINIGCEKNGDARYRMLDEETQRYCTHILEWEPTRIIEYAHSTYTYQGIVRRTTVIGTEEKEIIEQSPFIMYWNADKKEWEHFFGRDIPQLGGRP